MDFHFCKRPVYPYELKKDLIVRFELNSSEKVILCSGDAAVRCKLADISLEYVEILDEPYVSSIRELYTGSTSISYTKVISIHYQKLSKKAPTWNIDIKILSVCSLQGLLLLFSDKRDDFAIKNE